MTNRLRSSGCLNEARDIVLIDDNNSLLVNVADYLSLYFNKVHTFSDPKKALKFISADFPGVIISDIKMPGLSGMQLLEQVMAIDPSLPVILMTAHGDISQAVDAMKLGVYDFIEKPFEPERMRESVNRAMEKRSLTLSQRDLECQLADMNAIEHRLIGVSPAMVRIRKQILSLAQLDVPVLIYGETGSGKEVVANCLHDFSPRKKAKFVALNCAAIPQDLIESELFGHVKGAFSGAQQKRVGKLEYADKGSVFLDEVESIPFNVQVKLLRALSENVIEPLGANESRAIDIRIISATKESLKDNDNFRQDLYYRLEVAEIQLPPLRTRKEDIVLLFEHYAQTFAKAFNIEWPGVTQQLQTQLLSHDWPGNVRELINIATRCVMQCKQDLTDLASFGAGINFDANNGSLKESVEHYEKALLIDALRQHQGNISAILETLKLERRTFYVKLQKYNIERSDYVAEKS
ncbi:MAG: sigma-54-dependent Fis family transcriptional regulator [Gammaproteobacteria bacterium]|nr:sigma-54-dependent Fis family transcriptional regulator [Gammaproteobacteria bacterium]